MDDHIGSEFTTQPWLFSTSAAWLYCRMHGGLFPFGLIFAAHERASVCSMTP